MPLFATWLAPDGNAFSPGGKNSNPTICNKRSSNVCVESIPRWRNSMRMRKPTSLVSTTSRFNSKSILLIISSARWTWSKGDCVLKQTSSTLSSYQSPQHIVIFGKFVIEYDDTVHVFDIIFCLRPLFQKIILKIVVMYKPFD
jgi:hypothetical protein